jgi:hypothetical protein
MATAAFDCPRCQQPTSGEQFYGPCAACRADLRVRMTRAAAEVAEVADTTYEPKMNVVPNQVATKD